MVPWPHPSFSCQSDFSVHVWVETKILGAFAHKTLCKAVNVPNNTKYRRWALPECTIMAPCLSWATISSTEVSSSRCPDVRSVRFISVIVLYRWKPASLNDGTQPTLNHSVPFTSCCRCFSEFLFCRFEKYKNASWVGAVHGMDAVANNGTAARGLAHCKLCPIAGWSSVNDWRGEKDRK